MKWLQALRNRYLVTADPLRTQRRMELTALLLGSVLCLQVAYDGVRLATLGAPEMVTPAADTMRVPAVRSPEAVAAEARREIVGRPLFWASRRPVTVVDIPDDTLSRGSGSGELRDVKQVGVFGSGEEAGIIALVKGQKRRILLGESINGWTLERIGLTESEFANGQRREILALARGDWADLPQGAAKPAPPGAGTQEQPPVSGLPGASPVQQESPSPGTGATTGAGAEDGLGLGQRGWGKPASE